MSSAISSSRQLFLRQTSLNRRQPLLRSQVSSGNARLAEFAGGTAADCAAVCCCCPCGLVNLLVLVVYKVPAGLCRRVMQKKRRKRLLKKGLLQPGQCKCSCGFDGSGLRFHPVGFQCVSEVNDKSSQDLADDESFDQDVMHFEKEMWDRFYSTGFWRSPSQREPSKVLPGI